jgi:serine/threonine-protein kinase
VDHAGKPLKIVHRDISPHNVLITRYGEVKLVDFGLAKASSHLTSEDEDIVKGKFGYLAPEITLGKGADHRVDVFAAGILLWEMLSGRRLFKGETDVETFKQVQAATVPDLRQLRGDVSDALMSVVLKALSRDRDQRYQSGDEFARDLSIVLYTLGHPVTYQDIAGLVRQAAAERAKKRKAEKAPADILGDIIIDALHDFSDPAVLDEQQPSALGTRGVNAEPGDFVDPSSWGLDDGLGDLLDGPPAPAPAPPAPASPPVVAPAPAGAAAQPAAAQPAAGPPRKPPPPRPQERPKAPPAEEDKNAPWWKRWWD